MAEYIEREAANFAIQKKMQEYINKSVQSIGFAKYREDSFFTNAALGCRAAIEEVNSISAADVVPVRHGRWTGHDIGNGRLSIDDDTCSLCGSRFYQIAETGCVWRDEDEAEEGE